MPQHSFVLKKYAHTTIGQVVANYLDIEHILFHTQTTLRRIQLLSQTERSACFFLQSKLGPFSATTLNYYEFRPPNQFFQVAHSRWFTLAHLSTIEELKSGEVEVTVAVTLYLPFWLYPFRKLIEALLRWQDRRIHEEDRRILERRYEIAGGWVGDYLRPWQPLLFKKEFAKFFGTEKSSLEGSNG